MPASAKRFPSTRGVSKKRRIVYFIVAAEAKHGRRVGPYEEVIDESGEQVRTESKWEAEQIVNYLEARGFLAYYEVL